MIPPSDRLPALSPLPRSGTTADAVEQRLIVAIAMGDRKGGERITETDLATALNVSRVPVREAMLRLQVRGILVGGEQRGLRVADYDPTRLTQLIELRLAIEKIIFRDVMRDSSTRRQLVATLETRLQEMADLSLSGDPFALGTADLEFHRTVARHAGNDLALQMWEGLAQHMIIAFCRDWNQTFDRTGEVRLHQDLLEFVRSGDPANIEPALIDHFRSPSAPEGGSIVQGAHLPGGKPGHPDGTEE